MIAAVSTFKMHEPYLNELLEGIHKGDIQLPDFQRGWVWDDDRIRALIASVSVSYPIGVVMLLETGGEGVRFLARTFAGAPNPAPNKPQKLALDGQQRLTSLYTVLRSGNPVATMTAKGAPVQRLYYFDMAKCLDPDVERVDAVMSLPPDRKLKSNFDRNIDLDVSTDELEYMNGLIPLSILLDSVRYSNWKRGYNRLYRNDNSRLDLLDSFESNVWKRFIQYRVPVIELVKETPKAAVCQVFEKVNTGGVSLTVFELVTASFAADDFKLRRDWEERKKRLDVYKVLHDLDSSDFLASVTLLTTYQRVQATGKGAVRCRRDDILKLDLTDYKRNADEVELGCLRAAKLLSREKVYDTRTLPYQGQLIPLAAICSAVGNKFEQDSVKQKLARWYWCGVFGELYGGASEARFANDLPDVISWLNGGDEPKTIRDSTFSPMRLLTLQTRLSAAYKGVMARLMQVGSRDFLSGDEVELNTYFETNIDIHHVFPKAYCEKQDYDSKFWNSVINKGPLSARTNRIIGGHKPSTYLTSLTKNHEVTRDRLEVILTSHLINPTLLWGDDFTGFIRERAARLLDLIEVATGKPVAGRDSDEVVKTFGGSLTLTPATDTAAAS
jgi:hypothetical protein